MRAERIYLDWNAAAPLRAEARGAMLAAFELGGNPSSVHGEGRAARGVIEKARRQVAALAGCAPDQVVFTSGASEANALAHAGVSEGAAICPLTEHDSVTEAAKAAARFVALPVDRDGIASAEFEFGAPEGRGVFSLAAASGETGIVQRSGAFFEKARAAGWAAHSDATQAAGRIALSFKESGARSMALSAHKIGGPKGVGAYIHSGGAPRPLIRGGGQEGGWRAGTQNTAGIAGFGAAAEAALRELENGAWERAGRLRDQLEERLKAAAPGLVIFAEGAARLPNTSYFAAPGWPGETQVMAMDLAGFAVSAGAACASGKVRRASPALMAMGYDEETAACALRVSFGPDMSEAGIDKFVNAWSAAWRRHNAKAA